MASDTVPAAVPGPRNDPAGTPQQAQTGGLTALFAAVEPARPAFDLNPARTDDQTTNQQPGPDLSSADFHGADQTTPSGDKTKTTTRQEKSVLRAWMLAGAERWRQGGVARVKNLEWRKAQAAAMQVKETRQVSVNRSGGFLGGAGKGNSGTNSGGGKGLSTKSGSGNSSTKGPKAPKNSPSGGSRSGSGGNSGGPGSAGRGSGTGAGGGKGPAGRGNGSSGTGSGAGTHSRTDTARTPKKTPNKEPKHAADTGGGTRKTLDTRHDSRTNRPWNSPKDSKAQPAGTSGGTGSGSGKGASKDRTPQHPAPKTTVKDPKKQTAGGTGGTGGTSGKAGQDPAGKNTSSGGGQTKQPAKHDLRKKPTNPDTPGTGTGTGPKGAKNTGGAKTPTPDGPGKKLNTRESREAGYRDGTRAATATAHVRAYRDGVRDGWTDRTEAATRQKTALDKAHQTRKQELGKQREKEQPVPEARTSADFHPAPQNTETTGPATGPTPIPVQSVDQTGVHLGAGASRPAISHGEVRNLKKFERLLRAKSDSMTRVAEATKVLKQHADEQVRQITALTEQARGVKGGDALLSALAKTQDAAAGQASKAEEIHTRAQRAAEACKVLLANVEARYGGIYKAVIDSGLIAPADMHYYEDRESAHA